MSDKGFIETFSETKTEPNNIGHDENPLKIRQKKFNRVDINVLKAKLQESESRQFKKNLIILSSLIIVLAVLGIYLSL